MILNFVALILGITEVLLAIHRPNDDWFFWTGSGLGLSLIVVGFAGMLS